MMKYFLWKIIMFVQVRVARLRESRPSVEKKIVPCAASLSASASAEEV
jgi:hypothetical protein